MTTETNAASAAEDRELCTTCNDEGGPDSSCPDCGNPRDYMEHEAGGAAAHTPGPWEDIVDAVGETLGVDTGAIHEDRFADAVEAARRAADPLLRERDELAGALRRTGEALRRTTDTLEALAGADVPPGHVDYLNKAAMARAAEVDAEFGSDAIKRARAALAKLEGGA